VYELTKADLRPEIAQELAGGGRGLKTIELDNTVPMTGSSAWFSQHIGRLFELNVA
jgi:hypothetical protein